MLIFLSFLRISFSQETGNFKGIVKAKETGEVLIGAHVILKKDPSIGTVTNTEGEFSILLKPGNYFFVISFTNMKTDTVSVIIVGGKTVERIIELRTYTIVFDEIEITAGKFEKNIEDLTFSIDVIQPQLIENKNTRSINTILDLVPGLNILDEEPQLRGGSGFTMGVGSKVAILVDDMPILSGDAGRPYWEFIPVENIEQIEIIKGASSVLSGASALSGAIYIRTAFPKLEPLTKVNVYTGFYSAPRDKSQKWWDDYPYIIGTNFLHSRQIGNLDLVLGGNVNFDHGFIGAPRPGPHVNDTITNFSDKQMKSRRARFNFNIRRRSKKIEGLNFGLNGNFMIDKSNLVIAWLDDTTNFFRAYPGGVVLRNRFMFYADPYINFYSNIGVKHSLKARVMYNDNKMSNDQLNQTLSIYGDYQFRKNFVNLNDLEFIFGMSNQYVSCHDEMYMGSGSPNNKMQNFSLYLQIEKKFWNAINISLGTRTEYYSMNDTIKEFKPIFRVGTSIKLMQETYMRASFGQGYRFPTITERYIRTSFGSFGVFDNPYLKPEYSWNAEVGFKQGFKFGNYFGYFDIAAFWQEYSNTIEYLFGFWDSTYTFAVAGFKFVNTGKSRILGLDISVTGQARLNDYTYLNGIIGYNYILPEALEPDMIFAHDYNPGGKTEFSYNSTSIDPSRRILKYRFLHTIKADIELIFKEFAFGFSLKYFSKMENLDKAIEEFEDVTKKSGGSLQPVYYMNYFNHHNNGNLIMDGRISYKFLEHHKIALIVNNFLNRTYSLRPLKAEQMRTVMLQYS
ncbi:MAG: TonB-dependent receptor, partial [Bacteroidales bacterium]|nr:TonB-dependent receptor [Bacteroidales bacterium]